MILLFWDSLTFPARQQRERALWMINLLDLKLGSLKSFGPEKYKHTGFCSTTTAEKHLGIACKYWRSRWWCTLFLKLYLCILGRVNFHSNHFLSPFLHLPVCLVSDILKANQGGSCRETNSAPITLCYHSIWQWLIHGCSLTRLRFQDAVMNISASLVFVIDYNVCPINTTQIRPMWRQLCVFHKLPCLSKHSLKLQILVSNCKTAKWFSVICCCHPLVLTVTAFIKPSRNSSKLA